MKKLILVILMIFAQITKTNHTLVYIAPQTQVQTTNQLQQIQQVNRWNRLCGDKNCLSDDATYKRTLCGLISCGLTAIVVMIILFSKNA